MAKKKIPSLNLSDRIADHLIQAVLIFASVFLAFWMSANREKNQMNDATQKSKIAIIKEFEANQKILERWIPYHKELQLGLEYLLVNQVDTISQFNPSLIQGYNKGIMQEIITTYASDFIKDNQLNFDIETKMLVNKTYQQHAYVDKAIRDITDDFFTKMELFEEKHIINNYNMFYLLIQELIGQEEALLENLKKTIEKIN